MTFHKYILIGGYFLITINLSYGQAKNFWAKSKNSSAERIEKDIETRASLFYELDIENAKNSIINNSASDIIVPLPDGTFTELHLTENKLMSPELASKYPFIKTYNVMNDSGITGTLDITPKGLHGFLFTPKGTVYIDPVNIHTRTLYQTYYRQNYVQKEISIQNSDIYKTEGTEFTTRKDQNTNARASGSELRKYRIAVTATGEYTQFHGGSVVDALSAIVTTMNRVAGIYEREVAITFELVADNDLLIYTNATTDPYSNDNTSAFIDEVQSNIDVVIGTSSYDIGHGFSTGAGGLAGPGPCTNSKATGVTGISNPIGDPFDVDYVAHEIGHQFGANHTFNGNTASCSGNRNPSTAFEPGSGSTILAYAGICSPQNIQNNSDPYFHGASYDEILAYSIDGSGNNCPTITSTDNTPPIAVAGAGGFTIPSGTPFKLTGIGTDADGNDLTYSWEQFDLGPEGDPNLPSGNAPLFRSFNPTSEPTRYFPQLSDVINNTQTKGEILPDYDRSLTFRLTVRDGVGGVNNDQLSFNVITDGGPFEVTSFNTSTTINAFENIEVTWNTANTEVNQVNCQSVNILLSTDGGLTYPISLIEGTLNDGVETVLIPDLNSSTARIKVEAADNIFFDVNNADITIAAPSTSGFSLSLSSINSIICAPETGQIDVSIGSILGYSEEVTLNVAGLTDNIIADFSQNPVITGNTTVLTVSNTNMGADGNYELSIEAVSGGTTKTQTLQLTIVNEDIETIEILNPAAGETGLPTSPTLIWSMLRGNNSYSVDIATDEDFTNLVFSGSNLSTNSVVATGLLASTAYFLRVKGSNSCKESNYEIVSFSTTGCNVEQAQDMPITISSSGTPSIVSEITFSSNEIINDLNILGITGTHSFISDLTFTLRSPEGTEVTLINNICNDQDNFNFSFDDEAPSASIPCPPTDGRTYQPTGNLSDFNGENPTGVWQLRIEDTIDQDGGSLESWSLEICTGSVKPLPPSNLTASSNNSIDINLNWRDNSNDEVSFSIERSPSDNLNFEVIGTVSADITSYTDNIIDNSTNYYYRIQATGSVQASNYSNEALIALVPLAPTNLVASSITTDEITLTWKENNTDEEAIILERSTSGNGFTELASLSPNTETYTDSNLTPETNYSYRLKVTRGGDESAFSTILEVTTLPPPPVTPTSLVLRLVSIDQIELTWTDNSTNEDAFVIERSLNNNSNFQELDTVVSNITSYSDNSLGTPSVFFYRVKAINDAGESAYSNEASESTLVLGIPADNENQTIIYPNPSIGLFIIKSPGKLNETVIKIYDVLGNEISCPIVKNESGFSINLSENVNGIYFITIVNKDLTQTLRVHKLAYN